MDDTSDRLFGPVGARWQRVSADLTVVRRVFGLLTVGLPLAALTAGSLAWPALWWLTAALGTLLVVAVALVWVVADRSRRAIGYGEGEHELYVTTGALYRRLVVVPYNRIQYVDVTSGPLQRWRGLGTVSIHTASPATSATVHGVPSAEAQRLRDHLTEAGHASTVGL